MSADDVTRLGEGSLNGTIYKNGRGTKGSRHDGGVPVNEPLCIVGQGSNDRNADKGTDKGREEDLDSCWGRGRGLELLGIEALALHLVEVRLDRWGHHLDLKDSGQMALGFRVVSFVAVCDGYTCIGNDVEKVCARCESGNV